MSKLHTGFQVIEHRPWRIWLALLLIVLLLIIMFLIGRAYQGFELGQLEMISNRLESRVQDLEARNARLVQENARYKREASIEHDAYLQSKESLVQLEKRILQLKEELVFYQGIVSPEELALGINIQNFELSKKNDNGRYGYKLVLTKRGKSNQVVKGDIQLSVEGKRAGEMVSEDISSLHPAYNEKDLQFGFRYFQVFEGEMQIGDDFMPDQVQLLIKPKTRKIEPVTESVPWAQALSGGDF